MEVKITGIVDNKITNKSLEKDWGFSALIKTNYQTILFDTGNNVDIFAKNINILEPNLKKIDLLFISHDHDDHTGGLEYVLEHYRVGHVAIPSLENKTLFDRVKKYDSNPMEIKSPTSLDHIVHSTGTLGKEIPEQSIIISTSKGIVIVTGCSHSGLDNILKRAQSVFHDEIYLILGGFHFYKKDINEIENSLKDIKNKNKNLSFSPTHCTGDTTKKLLEKNCYDKFLEYGAGSIIEI